MNEAVRQRGKVPRLFRSFPVRIYLYMVGPLIGLGILLTALFIRSQTGMLDEHLRREGLTVAGLLAHDLRVGVFSENQTLLAEVLEGATRRPEVLDVAVFNTEFKPLRRLRDVRPEASRRGTIEVSAAPRALAQAPRPLVLEDPDQFTFWAPIYIEGGYEAEESRYFDEGPAPSESLVGLVAVAISKRSLQEGRHAILTQSLGLLGALLLVAGFVSFLAVREASRPLDRLLGQVKALGLPPSNSQDELELLSDSFSHLVKALKDAFTRFSELNESLEHKVSERTAALAAANTELAQARDHLEARVRERTLELEETHQQLLHAEKLGAIGRISASFAHEINNPIFGIRNVLDTLRTTVAFNEHELDLIEAARAECLRVARLLRDLQSFNRPSSGVPAPVQLNQLVDAVLLLCRKELSAAKIAVETTCAPDLPSVWAVADQLKQVLLNLFTNAIDAMSGAPGTLRVATEATATEAVVRVQDTGSGISEDHLAHIFDPFFTTKPEVKGTGLGLSISRGIIQSHGGSIDVESRLGEGTTFTVRLPLPKGGIP
jgi:signal transduction histidine kinase